MDLLRGRPGEANRVTAANVADFSDARWVEAGALLIVLPECSAAAGAAICPNSPVQVELGDRADVARITLPNAPVLLLNAGDGADDVLADFFLGNVSGRVVTIASASVSRRGVRGSSVVRGATSSAAAAGAWNSSADRAGT